MNKIKAFFKNMDKCVTMVLSLLVGFTLGFAVGTCIVHGGYHDRDRDHGGRFENRGHQEGRSGEYDTSMMNSNMEGGRMMGTQNYGQPSTIPATGTPVPVEVTGASTVR